MQMQKLMDDGGLDVLGVVGDRVVVRGMPDLDPALLEACCVAVEPVAALVLHRLFAPQVDLDLPVLEPQRLLPLTEPGFELGLIRLGHWSLVIGHWSLVIGHWSLVIGHWSPATQSSPRLT